MWKADRARPCSSYTMGGGFWQSWEFQLRYFSKNYHVIGIDWPGFGESDLPEGLISLDLLTETLSEFIRLKALKNVILVGNCIQEY